VTTLVSTQVKESYNESDRIASVGIRWGASAGVRRNLSVDVDRSVPLAQPGIFEQWAKAP